MSAWVGVDVGGTKVAAARFADGRLGPSRIAPTEAGDARAVVAQVVAAVEGVRGDGVAGVGVGVPSVVDFAAGRVRASANIALADVPLRDELSSRLGVPVWVDNDANCAALAEASDATGAIAVRDLVLLAVGTGVGGGLVLGGRPYRGATGAAAEVGHTVIGLALADGAPLPERPAPWEGSLERLAAGRALDRLVRDAAADAPDSRLGRRAAQDPDGLTGHDAVALAEAGDPTARDLLRILGERLGVGIANAINVFDPAEVVVGGGVSTAGELLLGPARRVARAYVLPGVGTETTIRLARHGVGAGLLGAALMAAGEHREGEGT